MNKKIINRVRKFKEKKICLIVAIAIATSPLATMGDHVVYSDHTYRGETYFNKNNFVSGVASAMAAYWYYKNKRKIHSVRSYCYFDPKVETAIGCSWSSEQNANRSASRAKKRCKGNGGSKCIQFWANGKLKYKKTPKADADKFNLIYQNIGLQDFDAGPLMAGKIASDHSRQGYQRWNEYFHEQKSQVDLHLVVCGTGAYWTTFSVHGSSSVDHVRNMCVLRCQAFQNFYERNEQCFVYAEDGKFVSDEAERIFTN